MNHLLNGDSLKNSFLASGIEGEPVIWREGFALGPVQYDFENNNSLKNRKHFWSRFDQPVSNQSFPDYFDFFVPELNKLKNLTSEESITLWFEHDLFCQINLIASLSLLFRKNIRRISVVSTDHHSNHPEFKGLGNLTPDELKDLADIEIALTGDDLKFADEAWKTYCSPDPLDLQEFVRKQFPVSFPYLKKSFEIHFDRFPSSFNGLNVIQTKILEELKSPRTKIDLVKKLLKEDYYFGFGDLEYFQSVFLLKLFYDSIDEQITLNDAGESLLNGNTDLFDTNFEPYHIGGISITNKSIYRRKIDGDIVRD